MTTVNLMQFFPYTFLLYAVRAFSMFNITNAFVKSKYNTFLTFVVFEAVSLADAYIMLNFIDSRYEVLMGLFYILICFIITCFMMQGRFFIKLAAVLFAQVVYTLVLLLQSVVVPNGLYYSTQYETPLWYFMITLVFATSGSFLFVAIVKSYKKKERSLSHRIRNSIFLIFPITHILAMLAVACTLQALTLEEYTALLEAHPKFEFYTFGMCIVCLVLDFLIVFAVEQIEKLEKDAKEKEEYALRSQMNYQQTALLKEEKDKFRKIKHDILNILTTVKGFIEIGKPEKALDILSKTNDDLLDISGFQMCSNETINTVLYIKHKEAQRFNIEMEVNISEEAPLKIDDYDLCRLLHNSIDNALNAAAGAEDEKHIKLNISIDSKALIVESENSYNQKGKKEYLNKNPEHGNGISIIKEICSKYGGEYAARHENGVWYTRTYLDNKKPANSTPPPEFWTDLQVLN